MSLKFFDNFETFITYYNVLLEVSFIHTHTQKITIISFFWNFGIAPTAQTFFLFRLTEPTTFAQAAEAATGGIL